MRNWRQKLISKQHSEVSFSPQHSNLRRTRQTCVTRQTKFKRNYKNKEDNTRKLRRDVYYYYYLFSSTCQGGEKQKAPFSSSHGSRFLSCAAPCQGCNGKLSTLSYCVSLFLFVRFTSARANKRANKRGKKKTRQKQMKERSFVVLGNVPCAAGTNTLVSLCQKRWTHRSQHALQSGEQWRPRKKKAAAAAGQRVGATPQPGDSDPADPLLGWKPALCCCIDLSGGGIVHDLGESHRCPVACWP